MCQNTGLTSPGFVAFDLTVCALPQLCEIFCDLNQYIQREVWNIDDKSSGFKYNTLPFLINKMGIDYEL